MNGWFIIIYGNAIGVFLSIFFIGIASQLLLPVLKYSVFFAVLGISAGTMNRAPMTGVSISVSPLCIASLLTFSVLYSMPAGKLCLVLAGILWAFSALHGVKSLTVRQQKTFGKVTPFHITTKC